MTVVKAENQNSQGGMARLHDVMVVHTLVAQERRDEQMQQIIAQAAAKREEARQLQQPSTKTTVFQALAEK